MFRALVLLSNIELVFACSPVSPGQDVTVNFLVDNLLKIPVEFAYTKEGTVLGAFPKFASTPEKAIANLKRYVKSAITNAIKEEAKNAGIEQLVPDIANQFTPTVYYFPLNCSIAITATQTTVTPGPGQGPLTCIVERDIITEIQYPEATPKPIEISEPHQQFTVSLAIKNYIIAGWSRERWELMLLKARNRLKSSTYAEAFKYVTLTLI
ncbi:unnamed protein product [Cylicocyclus nassatus]|uniref:Uncharacterized protein n=1 Tax=Cylicocyclus nassatus TaxID=53992 RepID=A0AA36M2L2_CYLNA|nr:unnamed protein product [Cylicocyclus nassatus]